MLYELAYFANFRVNSIFQHWVFIIELFKSNIEIRVIIIRQDTLRFLIETLRGFDQHILLQRTMGHRMELNYF